MLLDRFGRKITYLRISVTDRCNFRCVYCMPSEGVPAKEHKQIMRYEEIVEIVRVAVERGVKAVRLTGGEPLVRPDLHKLVRMLADLDGIEDISITTNAMLLEKQAPLLADAGLKRVNISLDTLDPQKFSKITRIGNFEQAWKGILAAEKAGLTPIKINAVAVRGLNDVEFLDLARLSIEKPWDIRFIELMPINNKLPWGEDFPPRETAYISVHEIRDILTPLNLEAVERKIGRGPAREYKIPGSLGTVGFISPLGDHFCKDCNRIRLTSDGNFRPCLLSDIEIPVLAPLRAGKPIGPILDEVLLRKPVGHDLENDHAPEERNMNEIGG